MTFQPGANLYGVGVGSRPENIEVPHLDVRAPAATDVNYPVGKWWLWVGNSLWYLLNQTSITGLTQSNWILISSGNIISVLPTANEISVNTISGVATLSIPAIFIAPGSIASTTTISAGTSLSAATTVTGGTGVIATTGNVTATAGNITVPSVGSGLVLTPTVVTAGASPQVANGRVGSVTFSGVSIVAASTQTFTITNSSITGAGTLLLISMVGATTGSALTIQSIVNSAGSTAITVTNGTGSATPSVANITFTYEVLN